MLLILHMHSLCWVTLTFIAGYCQLSVCRFILRSRYYVITSFQFFNSDLLLYPTLHRITCKHRTEVLVMCQQEFTDCNWHHLIWFTYIGLIGCLTWQSYWTAKFWKNWYNPLPPLLCSSPCLLILIFWVLDNFVAFVYIYICRAVIWKNIVIWKCRWKAFADTLCSYFFWAGLYWAK